MLWETLSCSECLAYPLHVKVTTWDIGCFLPVELLRLTKKVRKKVGPKQTIATTSWSLKVLLKAWLTTMMMNFLPGSLTSSSTRI